MRLGLSRRAFLKAAAGAAAAGVWSWAGFPLAPDLRVASTRPLPFPYLPITDPDAVPPEGWPAADVLLVPAYTAARLIASGAALDLRGGVAAVPGRPHDPEGAFTLPHEVAFAALVSPSADGGSPRSLAELWQAEAVWPTSARLVLGAALMRHGYSPNDTHPGHLAEIERDLAAWRPRLVADPVAAVRQRAARLALALAAGPNLAGGLHATLLAEGVFVTEMDWVILRRTPNARTALAFLRRQTQPKPPPAAWLNARAVPLAPLPPAARARYAALWARLRRPLG